MSIENRQHPGLNPSTLEQEEGGEIDPVEWALNQLGEARFSGRETDENNTIGEQEYCVGEIYREIEENFQLVNQPSYVREGVLSFEKELERRGQVVERDIKLEDGTQTIHFYSQRGSY